MWRPVAVDLVHAVGLGHIGEGALVKRLDGRFKRTVARYQDEGSVRTGPLEDFEDFEAVGVGQPKVRNHDLKRVLLDIVDRFSTALAGNHAVPCLFQVGLESGPHFPVVLSHQDCDRLR